MPEGQLQAALPRQAGGDAVMPFLDLRGATDEVLSQVQRSWSRLLRSSSFIGGDVVRDFEMDFASYCGVSNAVGTANGTDALQLVLRGLGIGVGDEVLVPANTFIATAAAVVMAGATPRFVDVDERTLQLSPACAAAAITPRTAAIIAVHLHGQMPDVVGLAAVAQRHGVVLIEDAAQAHGATWGGRRAGSLGRAAAFSFYPGKNLGAFGDAGAVVTDDAELAERIRALANHGRRAGVHDDHQMVGTNSRLDALQACVLHAKLPLLDGWNAARAQRVGDYRQILADDPVTFPDVHPQVQGAYHLAVVRLSDRDEVQTELERLGIQTGVHYRQPCHRTPAFAGDAQVSLPVAEKAAREILSLPLWPQMSARHVERVCTALQQVLAVVRA